MKSDMAYTFSLVYAFFIIASLFSISIHGQVVSPPSTLTKCYSGSSSESSNDYPPKEIDCSISGLVCELAKVSGLDLYIMSCVPEGTCLMDQNQIGQSISLYDQVTCCPTDLCNDYREEGSNSGLSHKNPMVSSSLAITSMVVVYSMISQFV